MNTKNALAASLACTIGVALGCGGSQSQRDGSSSDGPAPDHHQTVDARSDGGADTATGWQNFTPSPLPAAWPSARTSQAMAADTKRRRLLMFGGLDTNGNVLDDLWAWDMAQGHWTNLTPATRPSVWPSIRFQHAMTYDESRGTAVIFGGASGSGQNLGDTWEWDPASSTWSSRGQTTHPFNRYGATLVSDGAGTLFLFGGAGDGGFSQEVWQWDGGAGLWTNLTPAPIPAAWPPVRYDHGASYDPARDSMFVFGGEDPTVSRLDDLWEWDRATGAWTSRTPSPRPPAWPTGRAYPGLVFAGDPGKLVLFAGLSGPGMGITADLRSFDPSTATWTDHTPSPLPDNWPTARALHSMVYAGAEDGVFLFAGQGFGGITAELWQRTAADL